MRPTMRTTRSGSGASWCRRTGSARRSASRFLGKVSPVHFFWGSFDLAVTRFSGRTAPPLTSDSPTSRARGSCRRPTRTRSAVAASGQATGGSGEAAFYSYAYPEPPGFAAAPSVPTRPSTAEPRTVPFAVRRGPPGAVAGRCRDGIPAEQLRRGGRSGTLGLRAALERTATR